jgi:hypothetical protein
MRLARGKARKLFHAVTGCLIGGYGLGADKSVPCVPMRRHMRNLAVAASACCVCGLLTAGGPFKQAIEVYTGGKPTVVAGDDATVTGEVTEHYPR